jgi:D-beta-D-heptose 7-phosphate kinase/D-beta-D-heptose 1-phosphate adenosyltransferase
MSNQVVFTNGCFDVLHYGHFKLLEFCRSLGKKVIVGLNSDSSVKRLKGKERPFNSESVRKFNLSSIKFVDEVIIFNEDTPLLLVKEIKPDIIVKGGDYEREAVVGHDLAEVKIFGYLNGYSTTETIKNISNR